MCRGFSAVRVRIRTSDERKTPVRVIKAFELQSKAIDLFVALYGEFQYTSPGRYLKMEMIQTVFHFRLYIRKFPAKG